MRVLCIDDDPINTRLIGKMLKPMGYEFFEAHTPLQGLKLATTQPLDLIFVDYNMPDMNGVDLVRALLAHPHNKGVPVVMLTAHDNQTIQQQALKAGCAAFLSKPLTKYALLRTVAVLSHTAIN